MWKIRFYYIIMSLFLPICLRMQNNKEYLLYILEITKLKPKLQAKTIAWIFLNLAWEIKLLLDYVYYDWCKSSNNCDSFYRLVIDYLY